MELNCASDLTPRPQLLTTPVGASAHPTGQNVWTDFCSVNKHKPVSGVFVTQEGIPIERKVTKAS